MCCGLQLLDSFNGTVFCKWFINFFGALSNGFFFFWGLDFAAPPLKLIDLPGLDQRIMDDSLVRVCLIFLDLDGLNIDVSHYIFI